MEIFELMCNTNRLHDAILNDDIDEVQRILPEGVYIESRDSSGDTPLFAASSRSNKAKLLGELLKYGASICERNYRYQTILHVALVEKKSLHFIKDILNYKPDLNSRDIDGLAPLHEAIMRRCSLDIIKELLYQGCDVNIKDNDGKTPLHFAVTYFSVENNSDRCGVNKRTFSVSYSLMLIQELLNHGAEIDAEDNYKVTPLGLLVQVAKNLSETIDAALRDGADSDYRNIYLDVKYHIAMIERRCSLELIEELLKYGASVHRVLENLASRYNIDTGTVDLLIKYGLLEHINCQNCDEIYKHHSEEYYICKWEIEKMIAESIVDGLTLYDFVSNRYDYGHFFLQGEDVLFDFQTNSKHFRRNYPTYHDTILHRLETKSYLSNKLYDSPPVFIKVCPKKIINISIHCVQEIASCLHLGDLKQFVKALSIKPVLTQD